MKENNSSYRHCASFGKRIEYYLISKMLKEGIDVYIPMIDDDAVDAVVKRGDGKYVEVQIKSRSKDVACGAAALFSAIPHEYRKNYWFIFYSERLESIWIMSSAEFIQESNLNKNGKNTGKRSIKFNGKKCGKEYCKEKYKKYQVNNFDRIKNEDANKCL